MKLLVLATVASTAYAYPKFNNGIPNAAEVPENPNIGHVDPAGHQGVSVFGKDFAKAGNAWTYSLCMEDSDEDGFTNGQELGDPCCEWTPENTAGLIMEGISDPNNAKSVPSNDELEATCAPKSGSSSGQGGGAGKVSPYPPDDDEDDNDEMAAITGSNGASVQILGAATTLVAVLAAGAM